MQPGTFKKHSTLYSKTSPRSFLFVLTAIFSLATTHLPDPGTIPRTRMPTWEDQLVKKRVPYHQLEVADFAVRKTGSKEIGFIIQPFVDPEYEYYLFSNRGWFHGYIKRWQIFSGLDRGETYRDPSFHEMKSFLPYAQALFDLNELYARQLGVVPAAGFPESRAGTESEAIAELQKKIEVYCQQTSAALERETEAFMKATKNGSDQKQVLRLAKEIRTRLDAQPAPTPFGASPPPSPSPTPSSELSPLEKPAR